MHEYSSLSDMDVYASLAGVHSDDGCTLRLSLRGGTCSYEGSTLQATLGPAFIARAVFQPECRALFSRLGAARSSTGTYAEGRGMSCLPFES